MANPVNPDSSRILLYPTPILVNRDNLKDMRTTYDSARADAPVSYNWEGLFHTALAVSLFVLGAIAFSVGTLGIGGVLMGLGILLTGSAILKFYKAKKVKELMSDGADYRIETKYQEINTTNRAAQAQGPVQQVQASQYQYMQHPYFQAPAPVNPYFPGFAQQGQQQQPFQFPQIIPFNANQQAQRA